VLNFHGELGQWHQELSLSPMKKQTPKKVPAESSDEREILPVEL